MTKKVANDARSQAGGRDRAPVCARVRLQGGQGGSGQIRHGVTKKVANVCGPGIYPTRGVRAVGVRAVGVQPTDAAAGAAAQGLNKLLYASMLHRAGTGW